MHRRKVLAAFAGTAVVAGAIVLGGRVWPDTLYVFDTQRVDVDSLGRTFIVVDEDTLHTSFLPDQSKLAHLGPLQEADFVEIAHELDVETAAIKAIVDIETGRERNGLSAPGQPVINFDQTVFRRAAAKRGINLTTYSQSEALKPLNVRKYGSTQAAQKARLDAAMAIDSVAAIESTFWGMFQVGGFNWRLCGAASQSDFIERMGRSEYDQLSMFANFVRNTGMLKYLKTKNWASFARIYNGPSYATRGYHTRLARAYANHKKTEKETAQQ